MCRPQFVFAMVLMLMGLVAGTSHAEQDGIVLDRWEILDLTVASPSAMAAAAAVAEQRPHAVNSERRSQRLHLSTEDVKQSSGQQQSDESTGYDMLPAGLHTQLSRKRSLLEANAKQLSAAVDAINHNQAAASTTAAGSTSATAPTAGRHLRAANITVQQDQLAVGGRYNLLASDAWNAMYGLLKAVRAAFFLLSDWFTATATGRLYIDNMALLRFSSDLADLQGQLADTLSKLAKLNADALSPLTLSSKKG